MEGDVRPVCTVWILLTVSKNCILPKTSKVGTAVLSSLSLFHRSDRLLEQTSIALVGKYTKLSDSYASVIKALEHSALAINYKLEVKVRNARGTSSNFPCFYDEVDSFAPSESAF